MESVDVTKKDWIVQYGLKGVIGLGLIACSLVFNGMRDDITDIGEESRSDLRELRDRIIRLEQKFDDRSAADNKRDDVIETIRRDLETRK